MHNCIYLLTFQVYWDHRYHLYHLHLFRNLDLVLYMLIIYIYVVFLYKCHGLIFLVCHFLYLFHLRISFRHLYIIFWSVWWFNRDRLCLVGEWAFLYLSVWLRKLDVVIQFGDFKILLLSLSSIGLIEGNWIHCLWWYITCRTHDILSCKFHNWR